MEGSEDCPQAVGVGRLGGQIALNPLPFRQYEPLGTPRRYLKLLKSYQCSSRIPCWRCSPDQSVKCRALPSKSHKSSAEIETHQIRNIVAFALGSRFVRSDREAACKAFNCYRSCRGEGRSGFYPP